MLFSDFKMGKKAGKNLVELWRSHVFLLGARATAASSALRCRETQRAGQMGSIRTTCAAIRGARYAAARTASEALLR